MTTLWLILLPLVGMVVVTAFRRWPIIMVPVTAATLLAMAFMALSVTRTEYTFLLGRLVTLEPIIAAILAFCYLLAAALVLASYRLMHTTADYAITLLFIALTTIAVTVKDNTLAAMFISAAAIALVLILTTTMKAKSSLQVLSVLVLLGPLLFITVWVLESRALNPNDLSLIRVGSFSMALIIALGLGVFPLCLWLLPIFRNGSPLAILFTYILQLILIIRISSLVSVNIWPEGQTNLAGLVVIAGCVTAIGSGLLAAFQTNVGSLVAFIVMADMGIVLISSGLGMNSTLQIGMLHLVYRGIGVAGIAVGLGVLQSNYKTVTLASIKGAWSANRLAVIGILLCTLSLIGFPFTAGFITRYGILSAMGSYRFGWVLAVVASSCGPAFALGRFVLAARGDSTIAPNYTLVIPSLISVTIGVVLIALGVFPNLLGIFVPDLTKLLSGISVPFFQ